MDITIRLSDALAAELVALTAEANAFMAALPDPLPSITPTQFLNKEISDRLAQAALHRAEVAKLRLREAYSKATPTEQAAVDAILAKYE